MLDDRGKAFFGVLNFPADKIYNYQSFFLSIPWASLGVSFSNYAYILHDKDLVDKGAFLGNSGMAVASPKTPHVHFLLVSPNRRRVGSVINEVSNLLGFPTCLVSLRVCSSVPSSLLYMIHYFQKDKFQYSVSSLCSNNPTWLFSNLVADEFSFTKYFLSKLEASKGDYVRLINDIGLSLGRKYKDIIYNYYRFKGWFK